MGLTKPRASQIFDIDYKQATRVITVSNITLTGGAPASVDGVSLVAGDRVLVKGQSTASQNGLYAVSVVGSGSDGTWTRTGDGNETGEIDAGMIVMVTEGVIYADTQWKLITDNPIVIGTTSLIFELNTSGNSLSNGTSNVTVFNNSNVTVGVTGNNIATFSAGGINATGIISATGNITGSYIIGNGSQLTGLPASYNDANVATFMSAFGSNTIVTTGNITGGNVISNGARAYKWTTQANTAPSDPVPGDNWYNSYTNIKYQYTYDGDSSAWVDQSPPTSFGNITVTGNTTTGNLLSSGLISVTGNITGGNISGTLTTVAQPNITSVGTLTSLTITGNTNQTGNINITGNINATGNLNYQNVNDLVVGDPLIYLGANNVADLDDLGFVVNWDDGTYQHGGFARNHLNGVWGVFGNVIAEPTTVIDWANAIYQPFRSGSATFAGANINGAITGATTIGATSNITGGNVLTGGIVSATGNVSGNYLLGNGTFITGLSASKIFNGTSEANVGASGGNITFTIGGTAIAGISTAGIYNLQANGVGNIGSATTYFNTVFAKATSAQYADLAEMYVSDQEYAPGTVVEFGGEFEITASSTTHSPAVAGIISTNPSYLMNSTQTGTHVLPVALTGRVPCMVVGKIRKGDRLVVSALTGVATALNSTSFIPGCIIGKSLETYDSNDVGIIEVAVGRT